MFRKSQAVLKAQSPSDSPARFPTPIEAGPRAALWPRANHGAALFLLSASVLLFELALTRIFSVMLWSNLAFMVVSTAMFGFGLSGVYLALRPSERRESIDSFLLRTALAVSFSMLGAYLVTRAVPFRMWQEGLGTENIFAFALWELALLVPFFFAGLFVASILNEYTAHAGRLYGIDLLGAGLGSLLLIPVIPSLGGEGCLVFAASLAAIAALVAGSAASGRMKGLAAGALIALLALMPVASDLIPVKLHQQKRSYNKEPLLDTRWSTLSRVDIAKSKAKRGPMVGHAGRAVWIDGGTNESVMLKVEGPVANIEPQNWHQIAAVYALKEGTSPRVMVIGSSGGKETLFALSHGAGHVDAVEMDPSIARFVKKPEYSRYMGGLFEDPRVTLINDEGRAYLRRSPAESFDIIQSVNNYTPVAMAAGALNVSETYLLTKEAFNDYLNHLSPDGVLALHRGATIRVALTAIAALRDRGVEHPERHIVVFNGEYDNIQAMFLKKSEWTAAEVEKLHQYFRVLKHFGETVFLYSPIPGANDNEFYRNVISGTPEAQKVFETSLGLDLSPATDDRPFLEHFSRYGRQPVPPGAPPEFLKREGQKWHGVIPRGDFPYVVMLVESALLSFLFVGVPLVLWARGAMKSRGFLGMVAYFAALGAGFIAVEICLMKQYALFLGAPAYSITAIFVVLLLGAGLGSLCTEKIGQERPVRTLLAVVVSLCALLYIESALSHRIFEMFLSSSFPLRIFVSALLLLPLGMVMGMPFSLGLRIVSRRAPNDRIRRELIGWAWGINGYATVVGSVGTIFVALFYGFHFVLAAAAAIYLAGVLALAATSRA